MCGFKSHLHAMRRSRIRSLPSIEETLNHPAYPTTLWALEPTSQGKLAVAEGRGGPVGIAWEIHGEGPVKLVVRFSRQISSISPYMYHVFPNSVLLHSAPVTSSEI
jgi:hypothetical protein